MSNFVNPLILKDLLSNRNLILSGTVSDHVCGSNNSVRDVYLEIIVFDSTTLTQRSLAFPIGRSLSNDQESVMSHFLNDANDLFEGISITSRVTFDIIIMWKSKVENNSLLMSLINGERLEDGSTLYSLNPTWPSKIGKNYTISSLNVHLFKTYVFEDYNSSQQSKCS